MSSVQKVSSHVLWKIETFIEEDTRHKKHCTQDNDASVPFKVGTLGPHTVLPVTISCPVVLSWISLMVWNLFPFKGNFRSWRSQKLQGAKSDYRGAGAPGWLDVSPKALHKTWCMSGCVVEMKLPVTGTHSCGLPNHPSTFCGGIFKLNAKFHADLLLYSLSHFECDSHTVNSIVSTAFID